MKAHKYLLYAAAGIITGLIIENKALILRRAVEIKACRLKRQTKKLVERQH